ncbi:GH3 auxin-responsive promoter family protein [Candidatus Sumerlaeota bacterium]|nr:GH3 auxin-responsive promoter family protein [Candidatus Sumerlaeota bacterium]
MLLLRQFRQASRRMAHCQSVVLAEIIAQQASGEMGRALGYPTIGDVQTFRRRVPVTTYEDVRPWINRMRETGDIGVMFDPSERLLMYAMSSGSDAEPKFIPVTAESHSRYRRGWSTWVAAALRDHSGCLGRQVLPIVSPPVEERTAHGVACGSMSGLSTETQSRFVRNIYAIPAPLYALSNHADKYYALARWGAAQSVSFLVTANPSSFLMLAQIMDHHREEIVRDVHDGTVSISVAHEPARIRAEVAALRPDPRRAHHLEGIIERTGHLLPKDVWTDLRLITNWMGGTLGHYLDLYPAHYGGTPIRDIGLIASEGRMTIPMRDGTPEGPLDPFGHFYEFIPIEEEEVDNPTTLLAHEVEVGRKYFIVLTNFSGLHRYNIHDVVEVAGFMEQCPVIRFLHKGSRFSNITGEKLSEHQVTQAVQAVACRCGRQITDFMVVPVWGHPPCYALLVSEISLGLREHWGAFLGDLERELQRLNMEYETKRKSGRLAPLRMGMVEASLFDDMRRERIATSGGRSEQYKPTYLTPDLEFHRGLEILEEFTLEGEEQTTLLLRR